MRTREDFFAEMSAALRARPGDAFENQYFQPGQVKVRLLEAHSPESSDDGARHLLDSLTERAGLSVRPFADDLHLVVGPDVVLAVDCLDPRFWQVFSTSAKSRVERVLKHFLGTSIELDSAWMPKTLLTELDGTHRWLKSSFEGERLLGAEAPTRKWRARFEGDAPDALLDLLAREDQYARASALTAIGSNVTEQGIGSAYVAADWRGNFVIGQGDFSAGASAVSRAADRYAAFVTGLEDRHRIRFASDAGGGSGIAVEGDVAVLWFDAPITDLDRLVEGLFAAREPFRLWSVPHQVADDEWEANAVDLHVGQPLRLEISPHRIRVLLGDATCGNTLARLMTNLQQHLDARVLMKAA
jgi:hypothetical protein